MSDKKIELSERNGDNREEITVEEIENGFLVTCNKSGYKGKGEKKEHFYETKKYFSKTNPLEETKQSSLFSAVSKLIDKDTLKTY